MAAGSAPVPVIRTQGLGKVYSAGTEAEVVALKAVDLVIDRGEFVAIMGPSGSGKSTLMNLIGCLDTPSSGKYFCDGVDVSTLDKEALAGLRRDKIGFVFQAFHVLPHLSVADNVALPLLLLHRPKAQAVQRVQRLLREVGLDGLGDRAPAQLSGGQLQRVAIARALVHAPGLILADEPTGNLDPATAERVLSVLVAQVRHSGAACLLVTHSAAAARRDGSAVKSRSVVAGTVSQALSASSCSSWP